jgi:hypothetical protein
MKTGIFLGIIFYSIGALANTNLKEIMEGTCENLGATEGARCVKLQRKLEKQNAYMDQNGASVCDLIWQWGSNNNDTKAVGNLVISCFKGIANLKISDEVKRTCNRAVYVDQGSKVPVTVIKDKVKKMMDCLKQIGVPIRNSI